jgi:hypothetical protein
MAKPKTAAELRAENRLLKQYRGSENIVSVINNLIRWGGAVAIAYFAFRSILALAGQHTAADIGIKFLADVRVSEALAWIFGGSGIAYGWRQRKMRRDTVERIQGRVEAYEKVIDPRRSSSSLTKRGETRPEDAQS